MWQAFGVHEPDTKKSHDNLYSGVIVTQLLRDRFTLVTNHGQNDVCSLWMW